MLGLTLWAMRRLAGPMAFGRPARTLRHTLFLLAPLAVALIASLVRGTAGFAGNEVVAVITVPLGLAFWLWSLWRGSAL